jgi:hypothetical protein
MKYLKDMGGTHCVLGNILLLSLILVAFYAPSIASAQMDQGTITGVVEDNSKALIPDAQVTLTATATDLVMHTKTDSGGIYTFTPLKIGDYTVSATAPGFDTAKQEHVQLDVQGRVSVVLILAPGSVTETVVVTTAPPLLQSQEGSVASVMDEKEINDTPLNGRNWVYLAQLTPGVTESIDNASKGSGSGDFFANGQRATQNDFLLDGIDNNMSTVDLDSGYSYAMRPPPDALAEFKIATTNFSAQFGHSAGAVINASLKSGTNQIHGDLWEYLRNTALDASVWNAIPGQGKPPYHENQFGATIGGPILRNKLFYFGDAEANRITYGSISTLGVPTALGRNGNFTEGLNESLTGDPVPVQLYEPGSGGNVKLSCNGVNNVLCPSQIDPIAQNILNLYPLPNTNNGDLYDNYAEDIVDSDNTMQFDQRLDWNASPKDQLYSRYSYGHDVQHNMPPLGLVLDGSGSDNGLEHDVLNETFMASASHFFNPNFSNEVRFGYNWALFCFYQTNYNTNISTQLGLGGLPFGTPGYMDDGGLPTTTVSGVQGFGAHGYSPNIEHQNVYQILDNVSRIAGNHALKFGLNLQSIRASFLQPENAHGSYDYSGKYTSDVSASFTGSGVADFLVDDMNDASISNEIEGNDERWYDSAYAEDDWRIGTRLTLNLGLRYDYFEPYKEMNGQQGNMIITSPVGTIGTGTAIYQMPNMDENIPLSSAFTTLLTKDNVTLQYVPGLRLISSPKDGFAPRFGFAYSLDPTSVLRGGFGIFYGAMESMGSHSNLYQNYPFTKSQTVYSATCTSKGGCGTDGITLEGGLAVQLANGVGSKLDLPSSVGVAQHNVLPYTEGFNLTFEHALSNSTVMDIAYVASYSRHLPTYEYPNGANALKNPTDTSTANTQPLPDFGTNTFIINAGMSTYNSLQLKLQRRLSRGLNFMSSYTWSHALDDAVDPLNTGVSPRNSNMIPILDEYTNSSWDVRQRFNLNGLYELPFGVGRAHLNRKGWGNTLAGGWEMSGTVIFQTGIPFSVTPNIQTATGGSAYAILVRPPYQPGGSPDPSNPGITCATSTRNKTNWYNPCAFANPLAGALISTGVGPDGTPYTPQAGYQYPEFVTGAANAFAFLGGKQNTIYGPGLERINMSVFKNFNTLHKQHLQMRADAFNVLNHPSLTNPSTRTDNSNGGYITSPKSLQNYTPDSRFFQVSAKYVF